jgi:hypothetical protein
LVRICTPYYPSGVFLITLEAEERLSRKKEEKEEIEQERDPERSSKLRATEIEESRWIKE